MFFPGSKKMGDYLADPYPPILLIKRSSETLE